MNWSGLHQSSRPEDEGKAGPPAAPGRYVQASPIAGSRAVSVTHSARQGTRDLHGATAHAMGAGLRGWTGDLDVLRDSAVRVA